MSLAPTLTPDFDNTTADVVVYARYSSSGQNDQSIDGQLEACAGYAAQRGFRIVGHYIDRATSGTNADGRPEFQRMVRDAKTKGYQYVLVWKLDRFARNRYDSAIYKNELKKHGVRVLSVTEGINEGSESLLLEAILEAMAEEYSRSLSQNVRRGMKQSAEKGQSLGGHVPLGYQVVNKQFVIDEKEAEIVRFIFDAYANGMPKKEIVTACTNKGWRTKAGKPFTINSFRLLLKNPMYLGHYTYKGEITAPNTLPVIIAQSTFDAVAKMLETTKRAPAASKAKVDYLLRGKLFCGHCGAPMVGESGRSSSTGNVYNYYACATKKKAHTCKKRNERKGFIEWYVTEQLTQHALTAAAIDKIANGVVAEYEKSFGFDNIQVLEKKLQSIDREIETLTDKLIATDNPRVIKSINARADLLTAQYDDTALDLASLKAISLKALNPDDIKRWLSQFTNKNPQDPDFQRRVIDVFINSVYLYDKKAAIYFNIPGTDGIVSYIDMQDDMEDFDSSDLMSYGVPKIRVEISTRIFSFARPCKLEAFPL